MSLLLKTVVIIGDVVAVVVDVVVDVVIGKSSIAVVIAVECSRCVCRCWRRRPPISSKVVECWLLVASLWSLLLSLWSLLVLPPE